MPPALQALNWRHSPLAAGADVAAAADPQVQYATLLSLLPHMGLPDVCDAEFI
jgi:hypothetical protein